MGNYCKGTLYCEGNTEKLQQFETLLHQISSKLCKETGFGGNSSWIGHVLTEEVMMEDLSYEGSDWTGRTFSVYMRTSGTTGVASLPGLADATNSKLTWFYKSDVDGKQHTKTVTPSGSTGWQLREPTPYTPTPSDLPHASKYDIHYETFIRSVLGMENAVPIVLTVGAKQICDGLCDSLVGVEQTVLRNTLYGAAWGFTARMLSMDINQVKRTYRNICVQFGQDEAVKAKLRASVSAEEPVPSTNYGVFVSDILQQDASALNISDGVKHICDELCGQLTGTQQKILRQFLDGATLRDIASSMKLAASDVSNVYSTICFCFRTDARQMFANVVGASITKEESAMEGAIKAVEESLEAVGVTATRDQIIAELNKYSPSTSTGYFSHVMDVCLALKQSADDKVEDLIAYGASKGYHVPNAIAAHALEVCGGNLDTCLAWCNRVYLDIQPAVREVCSKTGAGYEDACKQLMFKGATDREGFKARVEDAVWILRNARN